MKFAAVLFFLISVSAALPLEDPLNTWMYHSETFGPLLKGVFPSVHTVEYDPGSTSSWIWDLIHDREEFENWRFSAAGQLDWSESGSSSSMGGQAEFRISPLDWLSFNERVSIWAGSQEEPPSGFSPWHMGDEPGRHLYVDWGYVTAGNSTVQASLGRIPMRFGPGRFSQLLLSGKAPAMDMLRIDIDLGKGIEFTGFTATLDSDSSTWLSMHRLDISPFSNLRLGLSESILYSADGIDLAYGNLFVPWYPIQWNERDDDNAFLCFDGTWQPTRGLAIYSEFLIDDIQYENTWNRPNKLGYTFGADGFHRGTGLGGVVEYTAVQRYVYSQRKVSNYYLHDNRIIGCQLGPDADMITASASWCGMPGLTAGITGSHTRHGEGDVWEGWPDSATTGGDFPSGIVEEISRIELNLGWYPEAGTEIRASGFYASVDNAGHVSGAEDTDSGASLEVKYNYNI